jgi:phage-related protein
MPTIPVYQGARFTIRAWGEAGSCALLEFLRKLESEGNPDSKRLLHLLSHTAEQGPPRNTRQCRALKGKRADGLWEFKAPGGARIIWFYDAQRIIICSHGFVKKKDKTPLEEIDRAQSIKKRYFQERKEAHDS